MLPDDLLKYQPINEQEEADKSLMLEIYKTYKELSLTRDLRFAHFSASAWIVNKDMTKVLMTFHKIYNNWGWLGGHADGDSDLKRVALKEAYEESGLDEINFLTDDIISVEVLPVGYHIKNNKFVSSHLHLNVTYLLVADDNSKLKVKEDESKGLKWFNLSDAMKATNEEIIKPIYEKLNNYVHKIKARLNK